MTIAPADAAGQYEHRGQTYYFCNAELPRAVPAAPESFLAPAARPRPRRDRAPTRASTPVRWIRRSARSARRLPELRHGARAGDGEPRGSRQPRARRHDAALPRRRSRSTAPILAFMVSEFLPGQPLQHVLPPAATDLDAVRAGHAGRALGRLAVLRPRLGVGRQPPPEHVHADRAGRRRRLRLQRRRDARARPVPGVVPRRTAIRSRVYFEPAAVIVALVLLGQVLELRARSRTSAAIKALLGLAPTTARRVDAAGAEADVPLEHVHVGDRLRVRPGERVPVDGVVRRGHAPRSTSRWSPASRFRSRRRPASR